MRPGVAVGRWAIALIASFLMLLVGPAASASGAAGVRLVHALPGVADAQLRAAPEGKEALPVGGPVGFGEVGGYADVKAGQLALVIRTPQGRSLGRAEGRLRDGARYTVVAMTEGLRVLRDGPARPGAARLRAVHAAPELGEVDVRLGERAVAELAGFEEVADYTEVDPGAYAVSVTRPGGGGSALAARGGVPLTAGTASTAFVVGSAGEPLDVIVATDQSAVPRGAPKTGLGGLADGDDPVLLALLAGLLAAALGAGGYVALTGRSRGRGT